jgi:hypothetical protein
MQAMGPEGFFWAIAVVHLAIGVYGLSRLRRRPTTPEATEPWLAVPARSTFVLRRNGHRRRYWRNPGSWD